MTELRQNVVVQFVRTLLRGLGNVVSQTNTLTGLIIIIGVAISSWSAAVNFLIGAIVATLIAKGFGADVNVVGSGTFAFAGGYVGLLLGVLVESDIPFLTGEWLLVLVFGAILAVPLMIGSGLVFSKLKISPTALPVLLLAWMILAGVLYTDLPLNNVAPQIFPDEPAVPYTWQTFVHGILNGFSQLFAMENPITGAFILVAIFVNSRISGVMSLLGGFTAILIAFVLGYYEPVVQTGIIALNSIMTAIALGGFFLVFSVRSVIYALFGCVLSLWAFLATSALLNPLGLPALTIGFVLVVAIMMLGAQTFDFVQVVPLEKLSKPEEHLHLS